MSRLYSLTYIGVVLLVLTGCAAFEYGYHSSDYANKFVKLDTEWGKKRLKQLIEYDSTVMGLISLGYEPKYLYEVDEDNFYFLSDQASYHFVRGFMPDSKVDRLKVLPIFLRQKMEDFDIHLRKAEKLKFAKESTADTDSHVDSRSGSNASSVASHLRPRIAASQEAVRLPIDGQKHLSAVEVYERFSSVVHMIAALLVNEEGEVLDGFLGSGVMIGPDIMVTNRHVIEDGNIVVSRKKDISEDTVVWRVIAKSEEDDLALLRSSSNNHYPFVNKILTLSKVKIGETVYAIGSPKSLENTLSTGIVSGKREIEGKKVIQISASIAEGSSGGALFNQYGDLIGITTSGLGEANLNFATPMDGVGRLLQNNKRH